MSEEHNLTPEQLRIPRRIRAIAYQRLPMTCDLVRSILTAAQDEIVQMYDIPPEDIAGLDMILSRTFLRLREEVTQPFRTEQMRLIEDAVH